MEDLYLEPNLKARKTAILCFAAFAVLMVSLIAWIQPQVPAPNASTEEIEAFLEFVVSFAIVFTIASSPIVLLSALYFARIGQQTLRTGVYPPTGTTVIRRTRIRTGKQAVALGYLSIAFSVLLLASFALVGVGAWCVYQVL